MCQIKHAGMSRFIGGIIFMCGSDILFAPSTFFVYVPWLRYVAGIIHLGLRMLKICLELHPFVLHDT